MVTGERSGRGPEREPETGVETEVDVEKKEIEGKSRPRGPRHKEEGV